MLDTAKEKVLDTGAAVADKVADKTFDLAEKADDLKGKMHTIANNLSIHYYYRIFIRLSILPEAP